MEASSAVMEDPQRGRPPAVVEALPTVMEAPSAVLEAPQRGRPQRWWRLPAVVVAPSAVLEAPSGNGGAFTGCGELPPHRL